MRTHSPLLYWRTGMRLVLAFSMLVAALCATTCGVCAADPDFVGILALANDDAVAERLGLSEETRQQLAKLVDARMKSAVSLALDIKDLPPEQQAVRLKPFVEESERLGMELLSQEQRSKLDQLRIQQQGMSTLTEPIMAEALQLTGEQRQAIAKLLEARAEALTQGGEDDRRETQYTFERELRGVLSDRQRATWEQMAGLGPGPQDPESAEPNADMDATTAPAEVAQQQDPSSPSDTGTANDASASDRGDANASPRNDVVVDRNDVELRFNFRYQPWEDVLDWLAEQADLSLQSTLVPEGTFNYSDTRSYSPTEAIDLINGVLLHQGYTLMRRGRLLSVIDLNDPVPDVLVEFVPVEKLDERGEFELVKTLFYLAKLEPSEVEAEIGMLLGPGRRMIVMPKARQLLVTETAGNLRTIRDVIEQAENPSDMASGLTEITLQYVTPEEVLAPARALLGLGEGENVGEGISIAQDNTGTRLFANGSRDKLQLLEELVKRIDQERKISPTAIALEQPQLMTHFIHTADPTEALAVLQTLLAGLPDVRMSLDPQTNKIIALARPSEHKTISETIKQLEGEAPRIEVIQLRKIDPQMAVVAIGNFFSSSEEGESSIKIDADPTTMRLYVRATDSEIADIRSLIDKLEGPVESSSDGGTLRYIPLGSGGAESAIETARRLWLGPNKIELSTPAESGASIFDLREINPDPPAAEPPRRFPARPMPSTRMEQRTSPDSPAAESDRTTRLDSRSAAGRAPVRFASFGPADETVEETPVETSSESPEEAETDDAASNLTAQQAAATAEAAADKQAQVAGSAIRVEVTPNGVLIASEDTEALDKFEMLLRQIAGPQTLTAGKSFTVYFLKYCKADVASQLLSDILGGTSSDGGGGSLIGDVASNLMGGGGGILGALLGSGGAGGGGGVTTIQATGTVSIVADARLNCLVVQAMPVDIQLVEQLLKVIDREGSITDIQTGGKPHLIPIVYMNANDVATVVKEAYADRMTQSSSSGQRGGGQPNPADLIRALRGGGRGGSGGAEVKSEQAKMTIAVDAASNSLIITAPDPLYQEVRALVEQIDQSNSELTEEVVVVAVEKANPEAVQQALAAIMGQSSRNASSRSNSSSSSSSSSRPGGFGGGASTGDIQARIDAFRRMQASGAFGRGGTTGGFGGRVGTPQGGSSGRGGPPSSGGRGGSTAGGRGSTGGRAPSGRGGR